MALVPGSEFPFIFSSDVSRNPYMKSFKPWTKQDNYKKDDVAQKEKKKCRYKRLYIVTFKNERTTYPKSQLPQQRAFKTKKPKQTESDPSSFLDQNVVW